MATPQRFEGATIEEVLGRVRAELGHDAEIIEANRVRSGGLAGFFAKETFEVTAAPAARPAGTAAAAPTAPAEGDTAPSIMDLVAQISAAEPSATQPSATQTAGAGAAEPPAPTPVRTRAELVAQEAMAAHLGALGPAPTAGDADGFEPMQPREMPRISTEGAAFSEVLQRIASDAGPSIAEAVEGRLAGSLTPVGPVATAAAHVAPALAPAPTPVAPAAALPTPVDPTPTAVVEEPEPPSPTERLLGWLAEDHLPRTTLLSALRGLPQIAPLPAGTGLVVVVVGERAGALRLCRELAAAHDGEVVLASATYRGKAVAAGARIADVEVARAERTSWRRRPAPTFVAVDSPSSPLEARQAWVRDVVGALDAHRVIGLVPAARKPEDVAGWARAIGGVDGLALTELTETTSPHAVLALEVPIAYLDGAPATPLTWADALADCGVTRGAAAPDTRQVALISAA